MKKQIWIFLLVILNGILLTSSAADKYFNTRCVVNTDCGLNNHLKCIDNYCSCEKNTQIYNRDEQSCQLLSGQKCRLPLYRISPQGKFLYDPASHPIKCIPTADCTKSVCTCKSGYQSSLDDLCKLDFGSKCAANEECNGDDGLACIQGACECSNTTMIYQDQFGCVHPKDPTYVEIMNLLQETRKIFQDNSITIQDMLRELQLSEEESAGNAIPTKAQRRQDTYNTNDLIFAAQENSETTSSPGGGGGLFNFRRFFQRFRNFLPRGNGTLLRNFRNFFRGSPGGYPDASTTVAPTYGPPPPTYGPPPETGYSASGQPERGPLLGNIGNGGLRNLFQNLRMRYQKQVMRVRNYIRNIRNRWFGSGGDPPPTTEAAPPPPAPAILNPPPTIIASSTNPTPSSQNTPPPPTVIQSNGNFQNNPIFDNNNNNANSNNAQSNQGQGTVQLLTRTRDRFRNLLRGSAGYSYAPPSSYGAPDGETAAPPAADSPPPTEGGAEPAGSSNFFTNAANRPASSVRVQEQQQFSAVVNGGRTIGSGSATTTSFVSQQTREIRQRQPSFSQQQQRQASSSAGQGSNFQGFVTNGGTQQQTSSSAFEHLTQATRNLRNSDNQQNHVIPIIRQNSFNAQQSVAYPQTSESQDQPTISQFQRPPPPEEPPSIYSILNDKINNNNDILENEDEKSLLLALALQKEHERAQAVKSDLEKFNSIPRFPSSLAPEALKDNLRDRQQPYSQQYFQENNDQHAQQTSFQSFTTATPPRYNPTYEQSYRNVPRFERANEEESDDEEDYEPRSNSNAQSWRDTF